jgi:hypothetical protein
MVVAGLLLSTVPTPMAYLAWWLQGLLPMAYGCGLITTRFAASGLWLWPSGTGPAARGQWLWLDDYGAYCQRLWLWLDDYGAYCQWLIVKP